MPQLLKRKVAALCCAVNGCAYCTAHSCNMLKRPNTGDPMSNEGWGISEEELQGIISGETKAPTEMEQAVYDYARAASEDAPNVPREILDRLKKHLTPPQIVELACVVGRRGRDIAAGEAMAHVFGFTIFNDFSARGGDQYPFGGAPFTIRDVIADLIRADQARRKRCGLNGCGSMACGSPSICCASRPTITGMPARNLSSS